MHVEIVKRLQHNKAIDSEIIKYEGGSVIEKA